MEIRPPPCSLGFSGAGFTIVSLCGRQSCCLWRGGGREGRRREGGGRGRGEEEGEEGGGGEEGGRCGGRRGRKGERVGEGRGGRGREGRRGKREGGAGEEEGKGEEGGEGGGGRGTGGGRRRDGGGGRGREEDQLGDSPFPPQTLAGVGGQKGLSLRPAPPPPRESDGAPQQGCSPTRVPPARCHRGPTDDLKASEVQPRVSVLGTRTGRQLVLALVGLTGRQQGPGQLDD